jgi:hypothetical protein
MGRLICEVCGTYEGTPHRGDCPLKPKRQRAGWRRKGFGIQTLIDSDGKRLATVRRQDHCCFWYVFILDNEEPDGERFATMWEAKMYAEENFERRQREHDLPLIPDSPVKNPKNPRRLPA